MRSESRTPYMPRLRVIGDPIRTNQFKSVGRLWFHTIPWWSSPNAWEPCVWGGSLHEPRDPALLRRLLRDTDFGITEIAFATGWESLGTFGRIFRDITGQSPSALRIEARNEMSQLDRVPACILKAAQRPDLKMAVLEKRRRLASDKKRTSTKEEDDPGPVSQPIARQIVRLRAAPLRADRNYVRAHRNRPPPAVAAIPAA